MFETTQGSVDIGLMTRNIGAMKTFYGDVLGLKEEAVRDIAADFVLKAGFGKGAIRLHALRFGDILVKLLEVPGPPPSGAGAADALSGFRYLTFWVKDMEAAVDHLRKAGVPLLSGILSRVPERKMIFFKDPDGNLLELNWIAPSS